MQHSAGASASDSPTVSQLPPRARASAQMEPAPALPSLANGEARFGPPGAGVGPLDEPAPVPSPADGAPSQQEPAPADDKGVAAPQTRRSDHASPSPRMFRTRAACLRDPIRNDPRYNCCLQRNPRRLVGRRGNSAQELNHETRRKPDVVSKHEGSQIEHKAKRREASSHRGAQRLPDAGHLCLMP